MVKLSKIQVGMIIIIISIITLTISVSYMNFIKLDVYVQKTNGDLVSKSGVEYELSNNLDNVETEKTIGKCKGDNFLGFKTWIIKLKGIDANDKFLVRGFMNPDLYYTKKNQKQNKLGQIDKNNIISFKLHNIKAEEIEIKNKLDRDKIIDLINSVNITKSGVELQYGVGFGVIITYSNREKFSASFLATTMVYSFDDKSIWCDIDKNIVDDLRNYYDTTTAN